LAGFNWNYDEETDVLFLSADELMPAGGVDVGGREGPWVWYA
jgi:hypothetical protein